MPYFYMKQMTQFTEMKKELSEIEMTLILTHDYLTDSKKKDLLDRAEFLRSYIYNMQ